MEGEKMEGEKMEGKKNGRWDERKKLGATLRRPRFIFLNLLIY